MCVRGVVGCCVYICVCEGESTAQCTIPHSDSIPLRLLICKHKPASHRKQDTSCSSSMKQHLFISLREEAELPLFSIFCLFAVKHQIKLKCPCLAKKGSKGRKGSATLSELPLGCRLRSFRSRCRPRSPPPNTTFPTYPVDTHHTLICNFHVFKCQPAVDYAARFAIKGASQKNLKHSEGKGSKVLFLKGIHYHNKEHTISLIKQACCRRATTHSR